MNRNSLRNSVRMRKMLQMLVVQDASVSKASARVHEQLQQLQKRDVALRA